MPPEAWPILGVAVSIIGSFLAVRLQISAQNKKTEAEREVGAGQLALDVAKEAKADSAAAKLEAANARTEAHAAHDQAHLAQRALHETRVWYVSEHLPWDQAVMRVLERLDPAAAEKLPPRKEPPLWPTNLTV